MQAMKVLSKCLNVMSKVIETFLTFENWGFLIQVPVSIDNCNPKLEVWKFSAIINLKKNISNF